MKIATRTNEKYRHHAKELAYVVGVVIFIATLIPYETLAVRASKLQVTDEAGNPVEGAEVEQTWGNHVVSSKKETSLITNEDGTVELPSRYVNAGLLQRMLGVVSTAAMFLLTAGHERSGTYVFINVSAGDQYQPASFGGYYANEPMPEQVVLRSVR